MSRPRRTSTRSKGDERVRTTDSPRREAARALERLLQTEDGEAARLAPALYFVRRRGPEMSRRLLSEQPAAEIVEVRPGETARVELRSGE